MLQKCLLHGTINDEDLLEMIGNHDDQAFNLLYKKYWHPLIHYARRYLKDEDTCEEIVQGLFVHLHNRLTSLKINSSVASYLYTALRNRISNYLRNQAVYKRHVMLAINEDPKKQNDVEQFINMIELQKEITLSLKQMPLKYSEVYVLHNQNYFTIKKIASILNRPVNTVEKQLRKAKALLRNNLKETLQIDR
ncbi:sigma-70 family RNA polymerase sigma factor [Chitinophagaceae bacterium LB-8]|uniref:Sigma-70 family RNA polymerase sigma factor n=1 Tax=Paraflavisolibacter caeni TaxID=2982496 RepID=A0A9X2Y0H9_9BACT|nr:sigma-70 family RNA polymerase sigma factor [Paraflavisolibacter caeni]MCU7552297.1 sigma-70 family RNA polymerase sigma factor [Paraflavisolibacter caeni]